MLMTETKPISKIDYKHFHTVTTRWRDNDVFGHINNVTYYSYFDTAVNHYLINKAGLDIQIASIVGFVVNSQCNYLAPIAFPDTIEIGLRVNKIGNSSVTYGLAVFKKEKPKHLPTEALFMFLSIERSKDQFLFLSPYERH